ncbi:hypothetical protein MMC09_005849 [Bachmanniomyces sp. S44760]|nr:hypothetical protein [Bachmanniomyces sp. S44760]
MAEANYSADRHSRRRPFTNWMKRLANLKTTPSSEQAANGTNKRDNVASSSKLKPRKAAIAKNSPYPASGTINNTKSVPDSGNGHLSFYTLESRRSVDGESLAFSKQSLSASAEGQQPPTISNKSAAPTLSTNPDTVHSEAAQSKSGTIATAGGALSSSGVGGGEGSTFSSPAPSVRSMTTTLTTIQSTAPSALIPGAQSQSLSTAPNGNAIQSAQNQPGSQFSHQFPASPAPASAIPSHVISQSTGGHPATYNTATANNILTDNASILTLASSSKRRRRNSLDTNASVRALAPSSVFGGSRESLPLSLLSGSVGDQAGITGVHHGRPSAAGLINPERASVYSSSGIAPALSSERNSYYAGKQTIAGDSGSVRSGLVGHGRNDSITGSIGGIAAAASPLASPREVPPPGRASRRNSGRAVSEENAEIGEHPKS